MTRSTYFKVCLAAMSALLFLNCSPSNTGPGADLNLSSENLFPFQNNTNWWRYSTTDGHSLSISVLDNITDGATTYFKVSFAEKDKDTTDNWFRRSSLGTEYSDSLVGTYSVFLPPVFTFKTGTFDLAAGDKVSYVFVDSLLVKTKYRKQVVEVSYPGQNIHGFDEIDFANGLGIVRMIDNGGRFPVTYLLDSAKVNGLIYRQ